MNRHSRSNSRETSLQQVDTSAVKKPHVKVAATMGEEELEKKAKLLLDEYISSGNVSVSCLKFLVQSDNGTKI